MQWPGTTAVLEGTAPLAGELAEQAPSTILEQVPTGSTATMASVPSALDLPCRDDPELFFAESPDDVEFAKSLCMGCAARITCLAGAIERREPWGVWGGQLFLRGEVVPYKRPRGRPRKATVAA
jgi:WhiB family transcriptional regulator, redox-sensing transcriptional regulator